MINFYTHTHTENKHSKGGKRWSNLLAFGTSERRSEAE